MAVAVERVIVVVRVGDPVVVGVGHFHGFVGNAIDCFRKCEESEERKNSEGMRGLYR